MLKPVVRSNGRASVLRTLCRPIVHPSPYGLAVRVRTLLFALWQDRDPSRVAFGHGIDDFARRASCDHAELPDSVAGLAFGCRGELPARRDRCSRSGLDRTADKQGLESGNGNTETFCKTLHRHSETPHQPSPQRQFCEPSAPIASSMPPCSKLSRCGLEMPESLRWRSGGRP